MTEGTVGDRDDSLAELARSAVQGDRVAFQELYERHATGVYNLVFRSARNPQAAEDICQEVWLKAFRELQKLREPAAFTTWLYRIAARACVDRARKHGAEPPASELTDAVPERDAGPEESALANERTGLAWEALGALPARQHLALFLREMEERPYQEIATILETSESAVETLLFRARRGFAEAFERLQGAMGERCGQAQKAMAVVLDGEATPVQQRAVTAHVDQCRPCRLELQQMRGASAAYGALPFLPVPALLAGRVFESAALGTMGGGAGGAIAKLLGLAATKAKLAATAVTLGGAVAVAAVVAPADGPAAQDALAARLVALAGDSSGDGGGPGAADSAGSLSLDAATLQALLERWPNLAPVLELIDETSQSLPQLPTAELPVDANVDGTVDGITGVIGGLPDTNGLLPTPTPGTVALDDLLPGLP